MGSASSMLTQYDIEDVQEHCNNLFSQQEIVSLYERFCQLDRNAKGFISADEFLSVPEFAMNPLSQRLLKMVDGLNFKDFVAFLSVFSAKANMTQKLEPSLSANLLVCLTNAIESKTLCIAELPNLVKGIFGYFTAFQNARFVIFKVYDSDCNGKVTFNDMIEVLQDLSGSFMTDQQREEVLNHVLHEAGYTKESALLLEDFIKMFDHTDLKTEVEVPVD